MRISDWSSDVCSSDLLRTADSGSRRGRRRTQAQRQCRALGQPQLRGPYPSANADELPGLADAGRGLRTGRDDACQLAEGLARQGQRRQAGVPARHLAIDPRDSECHRRLRTGRPRSEEHTSELQSLMRISYAVFCLKKKKTQTETNTQQDINESNINTSIYKP